MRVGQAPASDVPSGGDRRGEVAGNSLEPPSHRRGKSAATQGEHQCASSTHVWMGWRGVPELAQSEGAAKAYF